VLARAHHFPLARTASSSTSRRAAATRRDRASASSTCGAARWAGEAVPPVRSDDIVLSSLNISRLPKTTFLYVLRCRNYCSCTAFQPLTPPGDRKVGDAIGREFQLVFADKSTSLLAATEVRENYAVRAPVGGDGRPGDGRVGHADADVRRRERESERDGRVGEPPFLLPSTRFCVRAF